MFDFLFLSGTERTHKVYALFLLTGLEVDTNFLVQPTFNFPSLPPALQILTICSLYFQAKQSKAREKLCQITDSGVLEGC